jgi:hypothetical protein
MHSALKLQATVLPGHRLEIIAPELPEGSRVDVIVVVPEQVATRRADLLEFLDSLPAGPRSYPTWEEMERHFQQERNSWDR